ncbi:MAG: NAD(P)H-hydrate dehydratase [Candidatus Altiarchaeota archaeon]|nr:NAD(P)H-hydrate dehydratase [Candidatus Altiarchaeota archaeon]
MESVGWKEMRILDANSEWFGVTVKELMENAGGGVADIANRMGDSFVIICGPGNNGGDGFAAARHLKSKPRIFYLKRPRSEEALLNFEKARNYNPVLVTQKNLDELKAALEQCDVVIDAIFGTGITGRIREPARSVIRLVNDSKRKVIAIDIATGIDPDTGRISDIAVKADVTVALHRVKTGSLKNKKISGKIELVDIGIPEKAETHVGRGDVKFNLPFRERDAHKGQAGKVLVVGGSERYTGAPYFAAMAALKAGCDLSYFTGPACAADRIAVMAPDVIVYPLGSERHLAKGDVKEVLKRDCDVIVVGNGLGAEKETVEAVLDLVKKAKKPLVIDGDGLKAVSQVLKGLKENVVLTPHSGEFKTIFGSQPPRDLEKRIESIKRACKKTKAVVLLKGSVDIICQKGSVKLNETGNPFMAKGGTGDVLAGLCAGFIAQGVEPLKATYMAAFVNGLAGNVAYSEKSISMLASDVLGQISSVMKFLVD